MQQQSASKTWSNNWMSGIEDITKISEISIPGTHDSCARFNVLPRTQCQWFSITQQLNRGIRFLDIRCRYKTDGESGRTQGIYFPIHHGPVFQKILFEEVQAQCIAFLSENPTEFILMHVQMAYDDDGDKHGDKFGKKFLELTAPYQTNYWYLKNHIPTLDECRGRIVLIRSYDSTTRRPDTWGARPPFWESFGWHMAGGLEWNGFHIDGESCNALFQTQNGWQKWHGTEKGGEVEKYIEAAEGYATRGYLTLNFASYASDLGPGPNAQGMNERLQKFLRNYTGGPNSNWRTALGIIPIDFAGNTGDGDDSLENLIIKHQMHQATNSSYSGIAQWLITASA